jgi:hypothetical protein
VSGYSDGVRVEHAVIHDLTANGYECQRAASSKGVADCIAIKAGQILLVNVKRTTMPSPAERAELLRVAALVPCLVPLVALGPVSRLSYRELTGVGPKAWRAWSPDLIDRAEES